MRYRALMLITTVALVIVATGCTDDQNVDTEQATSVFIECLDRNGIEARDVRITLNEDGTVATIEAEILNEADVAYEPAVRIGCTQEVESR